MHWTQTMRAVNWSFKRCLNNLSSMTAPCMDPVYIGIQPDEIIRENLEKLRACGLDTLLIEGLRRLMLYEKLGISAQVRADIAHAVELAHEYGRRSLSPTCTFEPNLDDFSAQDRASGNRRTYRQRSIYRRLGRLVSWFQQPDFEKYIISHAIQRNEGRCGLMTMKSFRASAIVCLPALFAQFAI